MSKYTVVVKIGNNDFKKWRVDNLKKLVVFLDEKYADWRYFNVYDNDKNSSGYRQQLASYTKNRRP